MLMSVLTNTEAVVHTLTALTHLATTPVPVLVDILATDLTAQVTLTALLADFHLSCLEY